jgi:hypothetical protein
MRQVFFDLRIFFVLVAACVSTVIHAQTNLVPAEVSSDVTWSGTNLLQGTVTIKSNVTVRVAAGARVLLGTAATLVVNGRILAEGTEAQRIYFTRANTGQRWKGIRLIKAQESSFVNCVFEYADCAGTHLDYYDNDCNAATPPPNRNYHEAIVAIASKVTFDRCTFQNLPDGGSTAEGDAIAIISDDPQNTGEASANFFKCDFVGIGQGIHTRFSYVLVEDCFFTGHHGDNDDIDLYGESIPPPMIRFNRFINPAHDDAINPTRCSAIIIGNFLTGGDDHGIVLRDKCQPIVMHNFISNFAAGGISVQNQCDALIANNAIVNCGRGIRLFDHTDRWGAPYCLSPGSGRATVVNTIIWDCGESLTLTDSPWTGNRGSHVTVAYSNLEPTATVSANSTLTWGPGILNEFPQLETNLNLKATSPMIDAGTYEFGTRFKVTEALDGNGDGVAAPDIGAHDFLLATADSNKDGIPDGWMVQFLIHPATAGAGEMDPDLDGVKTFDEWVADTNPTNAASLLKLNLAPSGDAFSFPASTNRNFTVEFATSLNAPQWIDLTQGTNGAATIVPTNQSGFYRVRARLP